MPTLVFPRDLNQCPSGSTWHVCDTAIKWEGCCRTGITYEPCDTGCKQEDIVLQSDSASSMTMSTPVKTSTTSPTAAPATNDAPASTIFESSIATSQTSSFTIYSPVYTSEAGAIPSQNAQSTSAISNSSTGNGPKQTLNSPQSDPHSSISKTSMVGPLVGGIVGIAVLILVIAFGLLWCHRRVKKEKRQTQHHAIPYIPVQKDGNTSSSEGSPTTQNPDYAEKRMKSSNSPLIPGSSASPELPAYQALEQPSELPGPINIAPPPSIYAELPDNPSRPGSTRPSPAHSRSNTPSSISRLPVPKNDHSSPHIMSWATFDNGTGRNGNPIAPIDGPNTAMIDSSKGARGDIDGDTSSKSISIAHMKGTLTAPNKEPDWSMMTGDNKTTAEVKSIPEIVVTKE